MSLACRKYAFSEDMLINKGPNNKQRFDHYLLFFKDDHSIRPYVVKIQIRVEKEMGNLHTLSQKNFP